MEKHVNVFLLPLKRVYGCVSLALKFFLFIVLVCGVRGIFQPSEELRPFATPHATLPVHLPHLIATCRSSLGIDALRLRWKNATQTVT